MTQQPSIDYITLIKEAFSLVWHHRFLWWFGLLIALGGIDTWQFSYDTSHQTTSPNELNQWGLQTFSALAQHHAHWIITGIILLGVLGIFLYIIRLLSLAGLFLSVQELLQNKTTTFRKGFHQARPFVKPLFVLHLFIVGILLILSFALATPGLLLLNTAATHAFSFIAFSLAFVIAIPLFITFIFIRRFGEIYLVLGKLSVRGALDAAYELFRKNIAKTLFMAILLLLAQILFTSLFFFALLILLLIGVALGLLLAAIHGIVLGIFLVTGFFCVLALFLIVQSFLQAFINTAWLLFFRNIATIPDPDPVVEKLPVADRAQIEGEKVPV